MDSESKYPSLIEAGLRKKKKKTARGETGPYDPVRAKNAEQSAADDLSARMKKKMKVK